MSANRDREKLRYINFEFNDNQMMVKRFTS